MIYKARHRNEIFLASFEEIKLNGLRLIRKLLKR